MGRPRRQFLVAVRSWRNLASAESSSWLMATGGVWGVAWPFEGPGARGPPAQAARTTRTREARMGLECTSWPRRRIRGVEEVADLGHRRAIGRVLGEHPVDELLEPGRAIPAKAAERRGR